VIVRLKAETAAVFETFRSFSPHQGPLPLAWEAATVTGPVPWDAGLALTSEDRAEVPALFTAATL